MAGHDHGPATPVQPWPGGWLWALIAGIVAAILAKWLGDISAVTSVLIGIFVFLVFGVLLGMFWDAPSPNALGETAGGHHDDHTHDGHGQGDHGHAHDGHTHDGHTHDGHAHDGHGHDHHGHDDLGPVHQPVATPTNAPAPMMAQPPVASPSAARPAAPTVASTPVAPPAPVSAPVAASGPAKPKALAAPRGGKADDLKEIEGIGPGLEKLCHDLGVFHFDQIAAWGTAEVAWMDGNLKGFKGRVTRDKWVSQATIIGAEGLVAFRIRIKTNNY